MAKIFVGHKTVPKNPIIMLIRCCSCKGEYDLKGNIFKHKEDNLLVCPYCGLRHKVDFEPFDNRIIDDLERVDRLNLAIDVGTAAVNTGDYGSSSIRTQVLLHNPANATGIITQVQVYVETTMTSAYVLDCTMSGSDVTIHNSYYIGTVSSGAKRTFGVSLPITIGHYIGICSSSGRIWRTATGYAGVYWSLTKYTSGTHAMTLATGNTVSLYGTGISVVAPTVTTQSCINVEETTATGRGNITNTGGENCHTRGFCYMVGTSGDPTTANSKVYDTGSFGVGAYTKGITGLTGGTNYRVRAYAINSAGTGYGVTVQMQTKKVLQKAESFSVADSKVTSISKAVSEAFSVLDSWVARINLSEAFSIADSLTKSAIKQLAETCSIADSKITSISKTVSEAFSVADSLVKNVTKLLGETFSVVDSKVTNGIKTLAETFNIIDSFVYTVILRFYETLVVKDSFKRFFKNLYGKVTKYIATYTKRDKDTATYTKTDKDISDYTKTDKGISDHTKVDKSESDYTKKDKERGEE